MKHIKYCLLRYCVFTVLSLSIGLTHVSAQKISPTKVIPVSKLSKYLKPEVKAALQKNGKLNNAVLAAYFRDRFAERFFYNYHTVADRMITYNEVYDKQSSHLKRAKEHQDRFAATAQWVLPYTDVQGKPVNAYALRHLARQHKMVDVAFTYFNQDKDPEYLNYFTAQMRSLNAALKAGAYEKLEDGNGVYEAFRSGYRVMNWLWIHNMFLGESAYSDEDQLVTIATLLQHAQNLYEENDRFRPGNHQTKGMSSLAMLGILLRDFEGADAWKERAMQRLEEHLDKEINEDGFQFERTVHYHMSDINNYFYVYQLVKISELTINPVWESKLKNLFTTLVKISYPDKTAPVLSDDTDQPWAEKNDISGAMTIGYLLFEDPEFGYLAKDEVDRSTYWFLQDRQLALLANIKTKKPEYGSLAFPDTKYYIMREGYEKDDKMMIISAGVDSEKPDHQHGDILGIQAMVGGKVILPNYQVRYSLTDFDFFKNSMVKNVALVDDELQGKQWTGNKGGSGFGKFKSLPNPTTLAWETNDDFDLFVGKHDGFENIGVSYHRQVIYVKNDFWIVKDNFKSNTAHTYKQVWQGHYTTEEGADLLRATFEDARGVDILQLNPTKTVAADGARGKQWTVVAADKSHDFDFLTVVFPYTGYSNRIDETKEVVEMDDWVVNDTDWKAEGTATLITKKSELYAFNITKLSLGETVFTFNHSVDCYIKLKDGKLTLVLLSAEAAAVQVVGGDIVGLPFKEQTFQLEIGRELSY